MKKKNLDTRVHGDTQPGEPLTASGNQPLHALVQRWRVNADVLMEGTKGEWADPAVVILHTCADQLEQTLAARSIVQDLSDNPVAAPCAISGCRYRDGRE